MLILLLSIFVWVLRFPSQEIKKIEDETPYELVFLLRALLVCSLVLDCLQCYGVGDKDPRSYVGTGILGATSFGVWDNLDQSCQFGKCWLVFGTTLILDNASSIRKMMSRAWNTANWTPPGGPITSLWYVCNYVCLSVPKTLSIFQNRRL